MSPGTGGGVVVVIKAALWEKTRGRVSRAGCRHVHILSHVRDASHIVRCRCRLLPPPSEGTVYAQQLPDKIAEMTAKAFLLLLLLSLLPLLSAV